MDGKATDAMLRQERNGAVLSLFLAFRPVNVLNADLRAAISRCLTAASDDPAIAAVILASGLAQFSAGADFSELGQPRPGLSLAALCTQIEGMEKPVIAALNGSVLAGGLELALAAHKRIALASAQFGLPEASWGVMPCAGATQRLPRLLGAGPALKLMLEPQPISAMQALAIGLLDDVFEADLHAKAILLAEDLIAQGRPCIRTIDRRDGLRDPKAYNAAISAARVKWDSTHLPAPQRLIDCVEAAQLLPLDQGLAYEQAAFLELVKTPEALGLQHAYLAERRAVFPPAAVAAQVSPKLDALAVWGASDLTADLIIQALGAGLKVTLVEPKRETLVKALERIATRQEAAVTEGRLTAAARDADWARLNSAQGGEGFAGADLILTLPEAGPAPAQPHQSTLPIGALPARAGPGRVMLHPAMAQGLAAELSHTTDAPVETMKRAQSLSRRLGWKLLFTGPGGPIDRRLRAALSAAIAQLETQGLARQTIAAALGAYGMGVGPKATLPKAPPDANIVQNACLAAMANQGARLLSEGVARRPSDIDAVAVLSGIFPRWQGGPMFQADRRGLLVLRADLRHRAETAPQIYEPDALFDDLIADGHDFGWLDRVD